MFSRVITLKLAGHAFAAGGMLALVHDHIIMKNTRGWFCLNEVLVNIRVNPSMTECVKYV